MTKYRTIVADPPWHYDNFAAMKDFGKGELRTSNNAKGGRLGKSAPKPMPYSSMTVPEICDLKVSGLVEKDAHLYLWVTNKYIWDATKVARSWGFEPTCVLVWCKPKGVFFGGTYASNTEFVVFCRRGSLHAAGRADSRWFDWPKGGNGSHSQKPPAFYDLVESVSPGPYLELFARRQRLGWDTWGDEALNHVELVS